MAIVDKVMSYDPEFLALERLAQETLAWETLGHRYSTHAYVLEHGRPMVGGAGLPAVYRLPERQCFANAGRLAGSDPERFRYCEGFALSRRVGFVLLVHHAWVLDLEDRVRVREITWPHGGLSYFGIEFDPDCYQAATNAAGTFDVLDHLARQAALRSDR